MNDLWSIAGACPVAGCVRKLEDMRDAGYQLGMLDGRNTTGDP